MMGKSEKTAIPTIVVSGGSKAWMRKKILQIIKEMPEVKEYCFETAHMKEAPDMGRMLATMAPRDIIGRPLTLDQNQNTWPVFFDPKRSAIPVMITVPQDIGPYGARSATAGGIFYSLSEYYYLSVAHVFDVFLLSTYKAAHYDSDSDDEIEIHGESLQISDELAEATSQGSKSPEGSAVDDFTVKDNVSIASPSVASSSAAFEPEAVQMSPTSQSIDMGKAVSEASSNTVLPPPPDYGTLLGDCCYLSSMGSHPGLDYSLIRITDEKLRSACHNEVIGNGEFEALDDYYPHSVCTDLVPDQDIKVYTSSGRAIEGTLSGTRTFLNFESGDTNRPQEFWTMLSYDPLSPGDCGSWVLNSDDAVVGHIVARGTDESSCAMLVPIYHIVADLAHNFHEELTLMKRSRNLPTVPEQLGGFSRMFSRPKPKKWHCHICGSINFSARCHACQHLRCRLCATLFY
jgi:hypothetical protein